MGLKKIMVYAFAAVLMAAAPASAGLIYSNDFDGGSAPHFAGDNEVYTSLDGTRTFLGVLDGGEEADLTFSGLAPHNFITVSFDLYALHSLDNPGTLYGPDSFVLTCNGVELVKGTFGWNDNSSYPEFKSSDPNCFGSDNFYGGASVYHFDLKTPSSSPELNLAFIGDTTQFWDSECEDEGYGIDRLRVWTHGEPTEVPEPSTLGLLALGLLGAGLLARGARKLCKAA